MQTTDVRDAAQRAVSQSKSLLGRQIDERSTQLGDRIDTLAQDLRNVGDSLRGSEMVGPAAVYVDRSATAVAGIAHYLQDVDSTQLITDVEDFARRQPWTIAAGALLTGFAASRFLKTTSAQRYRASRYAD
jgi:hypothetical protein